VGAALNKIILLLIATAWCASSFADGPRQVAGPQIDVIRQTETGVSHLALRCSAGVAADAKLTCKLRKSIDGLRVYDTYISSSLTKTILAGFFKIFPAGRIETRAARLRKYEGAIVHYRVGSETKFAQGAVSHNPQHFDDRVRQSMERAGLYLEEVLDNFLIGRRVSQR